MFPIGANVQAYAVDDWGKTLSYWQSINPSSMVVTINSLNDKNRVFEAQQRWGQTMVIARYVLIVNSDEFDGKLHTKPEAAGDTNYYLVSPEHYMNLIEPLAANGAVLYWMNEPSGEVDAVTFDRLVKHTIEGIALADERKHSLCVLNWGVGHPLLVNNDTELDPRLDPVLKALVNAKRQHYLGIHLYAPADTSARLMAIKGSCKRLGIPMPKIVITEFGFDAGFGGDPLNGYKSRGMTGRQLADFTIEMVKNTYRTLIEDGTIVGITGFCEGGEPRWKQFNFGNDRGYTDRLTEAVNSGELNLTIKRTTGTFPKYFPDIKPLSADYGHLYKLELPKDVHYANVRVLPELASDRAAAAYPGNKLKVYDTPTETDNLMRKWQWCEIVDGLERDKFGWICITGISLIPVLADPVVIEQPPVTLPVGCPETFNTTLSPAQLIALVDKIRAMEASIKGLGDFVQSLVPTSGQS